MKIFLNKLNWKINGRLLGLGGSPEADWKIILVSTLILTVLVIALSVFIFIKIDKGEIFVVERPAGEGEKNLDVSLLKETVSYYRAKALEFERIKGLVIPAIDPSL
jgi:hypothetical protein